ncbi:hypothetical protein NVS47_16530 [Dehalobacterium formicoaceticum]|uniref:Transposase n=1 Tax=Dehalobacterium formicoaceticum TaxID=51515 RepID=A0ABT1Y872_9FIRM|nr:hypothetical protein [Dehalobacterium formicoaceticum]MCR6547095.1 hypothetical protein [Dehalobacterium formicoaceticum]
MSQSHLDNLIGTCPQITRNQVVGQPAREFESHRLRHEPVCGQCPQQALPFSRLSTPSFEGFFDAFVEILRALVATAFERTARALVRQDFTD